MNAAAPPALQSVTDWLITIGGIATSIGVLAGMAHRWLVRPITRVLDRVDSIDTRLAVVETRTGQLERNGGESMRDDVTEIRRRLDEHVDRTSGDLRAMWQVIAGHPARRPRPPDSGGSR